MTEQVEPHILKKYELLKKVGSGAYGHVWKVTDKKTGTTMALKKIFDAFQHSTDAQRTYREIVFLAELHHPNIISLSSVIKAQNDKDLYLVFDFMQADLHNAIGQKILKDAHNRYIFYQLMKGLKFMHSAEVIHRDLKPSNLLLNSDCQLKICDFGLARSLACTKSQEKDVVLTEEVATRWYRAPEVLLGSNFYDKSADVWSAGCILAEILTGKPIFPGNSTLNQLQRILSFTGKPKAQDIECLNSETASTMINQVCIKQRPVQQWFKPTVPQQAISLVYSMLSINPKKRPSIIQILNHPYLSSFHKPSEQTISDKIIQPPINDNTKLNLKEYRKLIYERIRKMYPEEAKEVQPRRSVERNMGKVQQQFSQSNQQVQGNQAKVGNKEPERSIHRQHQRSVQKEQERIVAKQPERDRRVTYSNSHKNVDQRQYHSNSFKGQRPNSQNVYKKPLLEESTSKNSLYRQVKTSNSNYTAAKGASRYSSNPIASNQNQPQSQSQKKTSFCSPSQKPVITSSSSSHHTSTHTSCEQSQLKKKNSLKQILKAKRQISVQSPYNVQPSPQQKPIYSYVPSSQILTSTKHNQGNVSGQMGSYKYQNFTNGQYVPQQATQGYGMQAQQYAYKENKY